MRMRRKVRKEQMYYQPITGMRRTIPRPGVRLQPLRRRSRPQRGPLVVKGFF